MTAGVRLSDLVRDWDDRQLVPMTEMPGLSTYASRLSYIRFLERHLYSDYEADLVPETGHMLQRLEQWILGADDELSRRVLLESFFLIRYVGKLESHSLYIQAYRGPFVRWLVNEAQMSIALVTADSLREEARKTWIGCASDSMHLDTFFHITRAPSASNRRPSWLDFHAFADPQKVSDHMDAKGITRIAIFEDVVGSGSQIKPAIEFALSVPGDRNIFVCPMIAGSESILTLKPLTDTGRVTYAPVQVIPPDHCVRPLVGLNEAPEISRLRDCIKSIHAKVGHPSPATTAAFGYKGTGSLLVQHGNTPDNCPAFVWRKSDSWSPIFPRTHRQGGG